MISYINADNEHAILELANSLWIKTEPRVYDSYVDVMQNTYLADFERVNFTDKSDNGAVSKINSWAENKTHGKIPKVLKQKDVDHLTLAVLLNAIYFKGIWLTQFSEEDTHKSTFYSGDQEIEAEFMSMANTLEYVSLDSVEILKMPYKGDRLSMLVVLPSEQDGLESLQESLMLEDLRDWQQSLVVQDVIQVKIPKFEAKTSYDLKPLLKSLGVVDVFEPKLADLTGIAPTPPNAYVSKAFHDAYVKVNEEGTEAAAVTTIVVSDELADSAPPSFIADRPFMFVIQDDASGTILFMGSILDPTK